MALHLLKWHRKLQVGSYAVREVVVGSLLDALRKYTKLGISKKPLVHPTTLVIRPQPTSTILLWTYPLSARDTRFALFRGTTPNWLDAKYLQTPIFCVVDELKATIAYQTFDAAPLFSGTSYYWLMAQNNDHLYRQGPFLLQMHRIDEYATP